MNPTSARRRVRAFTFIEIMMVVVIIGILAAVVVPRFTGATEDARSAAAQASVVAVRASIAAFRSRAVLSGTSGYPTLTQLSTPGGVVEGGLPRNPYSGLSNVQLVSQGEAAARATRNESSFGWNYYVNNSTSPPVAIFYLNSSQTTAVPNESGGTKHANQL